MSALSTIPSRSATSKHMVFGVAPMEIGDLRAFDQVPSHCDVVALRGAIVIFDRRSLGAEGFRTGEFYVREYQQPPAGMGWQTWLRLAGDAGQAPRSRLNTHREVVQAIHIPGTEEMALRLPSGFVDGPYVEGMFGLDLIGKVIGIYTPRRAS